MITKADIKARIDEQIDAILAKLGEEFTEGVRMDGKPYYEGKTKDDYGIRFNIIVKNAVYELAAPPKKE